MHRLQRVSMKQRTCHMSDDCSNGPPGKDLQRSGTLQNWNAARRSVVFVEMKVTDSTVLACSRASGPRSNPCLTIRGREVRRPNLRKSATERGDAFPPRCERKEDGLQRWGTTGRFQRAGELRRPSFGGDSSISVLGTGLELSGAARARRSPSERRVGAPNQASGPGPTDGKRFPDPPEASLQGCLGIGAVTGRPGAG